MDKFKTYYSEKLISEATQYELTTVDAEVGYVLLASRIFKNAHDIPTVKISIYRAMGTPEKANIKATLLADPNVTGTVWYDDKQKALLAFENLTDVDKTVQYLTRWSKEHESFWFTEIISALEKLPATKTPKEVEAGSENLTPESDFGKNTGGGGGGFLGGFVGGDAGEDVHHAQGGGVAD